MNLRNNNLIIFISHEVIMDNRKIVFLPVDIYFNTMIRYSHGNMIGMNLQITAVYLMLGLRRKQSKTHLLNMVLHTQEEKIFSSGINKIMQRGTNSDELV